MNIFSKFKSAVAIGAGVVGLMVATSASAAIYTYTLGDHPDRGVSAYDYGLRLDDAAGGPRFFSFSSGAATLSYNDTAGIATISGFMDESDGLGGFLGTYAINYSMNLLDDLTGGFFRDTTGTGSGSIDGNVLGSKASNGVYFELNNDGHRLPAGNIEGRGWVNNPGTGCCNDFLFTATGGVTTPGPTPVPVPAAGLLLLAGLGGLGVMRRRRKTA